MRRRTLLLAFGLVAAIPFAVAGFVLAADGHAATVAGALGALYAFLFPVVAVVSSDMRRSALEQARLAHHDHLTGLANAMLFQQCVTDALAGANAVAVIVGDVDLFKSLNDRFGHLNGDLALRAVAERLGTCVRSTDTVARLGGDEFGIVLPVAGPDAAARVARRIVSAFDSPVDLDGARIRVAVSLGIACRPEHGHDYDSLLAAADFAMYAAKDNGGGTYRLAVRAANTSKGPGQAIGALRPVRRAAQAKGG
jgi:diguanylate cyclase (GGDEF)-like protein